MPYYRAFENRYYVQHVDLNLPVSLGMDAVVLTFVVITLENLYLVAMLGP